MPKILYGANTEGEIFFTCRQTVVTIPAQIFARLLPKIKPLICESQTNDQFGLHQDGRYYLIAAPTTFAIADNRARRAIFMSPKSALLAADLHLPRYLDIARAILNLETVTAQQCHELNAAGYRWYLIDSKHNIGHWGRGGQFGPDCHYPQATAAAHAQFLSHRLN